MRAFSIVCFFICCTVTAYASQALRIEYRLEVKSGGQEFPWSAQVVGASSAKPKNLEDNAFLSNQDFRDFQIKMLKSPPNKPETFEIELIHTDQARKNFDEVANRDRERTYCVVIGKEIFQCLGFTPKFKGLWDKSTSIHGPFSKEQAERLITALRGKPLE